MRTKKYLSFLFCMTLALFAVSSLALAKGTKSCKWSDETKLRDHVATHVTYPATGKAIKETCKKEMPEEFSKSERKCFEGKINNKKEYKNPDEVLAALGLTKK